MQETQIDARNTYIYGTLRYWFIYKNVLQGFLPKKDWSNIYRQKLSYPSFWFWLHDDEEVSYQQSVMMEFFFPAVGDEGVLYPQ